MRSQRRETHNTTGRTSRAVFALVIATLLALSLGWLAPNRADAAITTLSSWSTVTSSNATVSLTTTTTVQSTNSYVVPGGVSRMLVVAVGEALSATNATSIVVTYGTRTMTAAAGNATTHGTTATQSRAALFYLNQAELNAASGSNLIVSLRSTAAVNCLTYVVNATVLEGVDQSGSPITSSQGVNITTAVAAVGPFGTNLTVGTGDMVVELVNLTRTASGTARTISTWATNWASAFGPTTLANGTTVGCNYYQATYNATAATNSQHTASGTTLSSMVAMSIKALPMNLLVGNGTVLGAVNAGLDTVNNLLDSLGMSASAGQVTVNSIAFRGNANFTTANIAATNVYQDNGTPGVLDGADVLLSTTPTAITGNTTTLTFATPLSLTTTTVNYLITVDITPGATVTSQVTGTVIGATGTIGTPVYSDLNSATITIQNAPGLTVSNGTNPADGSAMATSSNNALDGFTLQTVNATGGTAAVDTLTVSGNTNFTSANISDVHVYKDNGTLGTFDGADVLMPASATLISGNTTTLTFNPPIYVSSTTPTNYFVAVDITAGATLGALINNTVIIRATGHGLATPTINDTTSAQLTIKATSKITSCAGCHTYPPTDGPRLGTTGAVTGDHGKHSKPSYVCSICHVAPVSTASTEYSHRTGTIQLNNPFSQMTGSYSLGSNITQTNTKGTAGNPTGTCTNVGCHGYSGGSTTGNSPTPQWGVGTNSDCITCHRGIVSALTASLITGGSVTNRDAVVSEFGLAWGHKKTGRSAVSMADCIVCHLEGTSSQVTSTIYHANGYIDLRDPDGAGETRITNISGASYSFTKFSTSYTAGSRSSAGHTFNTVDNILTQKFCLACHDSNGAINTTARSNNGGTGTAQMPFGGINLGADYTVANGAMAAGGLVDVKSQVSSTWSFHPVVGPKNRDFPTAAKMADPYKPTGSRGTSGTRSLGVVMNCFDCHNTATVKTVRTIVSHGNATTVRGIATVTGTASASNGTTLCQACHPGHYGGAADNHGTGSAFTGGTDNGMTPYINYGCNLCHGSRYTTAVVRPVRAQDMHGSSVVPTGSITKAGRWATAGQGPIAFIRNSYAFNNHAPLNIGGTAYTPACMGGQTGQETSACNRGVESYTAGGTF